MYPAGTTFTLAEAVAVVRAIAEACAHIHGLGIAHGDVYGHNILWRRDGATLRVTLSDFGAAFAKPAGLAPALERLEVRSWACLAQEVLERVASGPVPSGLGDLVERCFSDDPVSRPLFAELVDALRPFDGQQG